MDTTRIRAGIGIPITPHAGDLHQLVDDLVSEVRVVAGHRPITHEQIGDAHGWFDAERISQVVANLLNNAVRHSPDDSRVDVVTTGGAGLEIAVHNEGAIPADLLPRVFEPFTKGPARHPTSLGLGLYIARQLVEAHGGVIEARSNRREGTTFLVRLPRTPVVDAAETVRVGVPSSRAA